jgi:CheY-like chemotaxis protein
MPEMDGFTVAARITRGEALAGVTLLMLSSADLPEATARCRALGIARYLIKPIMPSDLLDALLKALGGTRQEPLPSPATSPPTQQAGHRPCHILLAEDNVVNQKLATRLLEKHGHTVVAVSDGQAALDALAQQTFDLVLMDVQMPDMDGLEATAVIRAQEQGTGAHLPIFALTAHAMQGDRERCLAAGMDGYLTKPIKANDLDAVIAQLH